MKYTFIRRILIALVIAAALICAVSALADKESIVSYRVVEEEKCEGVKEPGSGYKNDSAIKDLKQREIGDHDKNRTGTNLNENEYENERTATLVHVDIVSYEDGAEAIKIANSGEGEYAKGSYEVDVVKVYAKANVGGGLYTTETGPDGQKKLTIEPGFEASAETGISVIHGEAEGRLGVDNLNIHGKVEADVLDAKAKASAELGIVNGKPAAKVELGAEANLAEVKGEVGLDVMGIDGKVTGGAKVGVGAKIDAGYSNGKFAAKVTASIGLGAEIGFEIDVSELEQKLLREEEKKQTSSIGTDSGPVMMRSCFDGPAVVNTRSESKSVVDTVLGWFGLAA